MDVVHWNAEICLAMVVQEIEFGYLVVFALDAFRARVNGNIGTAISHTRASGRSLHFDV